MGIRNMFKKGLFSGLNLKRWVGFNQIQDNGRVIGELFETVIKNPSQQETTRKESFEECMRRLNMTEEDLQKRIKHGKKIILFCFLGIAATLVYLFYLLTNGRYIPSFVSFTLSLLFLAYAFREHFNIYQMRQRRLGCSFKEYFNSLFKRSSK